MINYLLQTKETAKNPAYAPQARKSWASRALCSFALIGLLAPGLWAQETVGAAHSLQLLRPGPTSISVHNQAKGIEPWTVAISDKDATIPAGLVTFEGIARWQRSACPARGMQNVAIARAGKPWVQAIPDADGKFSAKIDFSDAPQGPQIVDVYAWDTKPDNSNYTVSLNLRATLFVENGRDDTPPAIAPKGHPAHGMKLIFEDQFETLSPKTWYAGPKPDGQEYGAAVFKGYDEPARNPYAVQGGFMRIRASFDPGLQDPKKWDRKWYTGHLSTGFPDGSASVAFRTGYAECRMLMPAGHGCWPSFWLLDQHGITNSEKVGAVEIDVIEGYGHDTSAYMATLHDWPPPSANAKSHPFSQKHVTGLGDYAWAFHTLGCAVTDTEVIYYWDGVEKFRTPLYRAKTVSPFFLMLTLAMSHDWPIKVPPSGYYDLWFDYVRVYEGDVTGGIPSPVKESAQAAPVVQQPPPQTQIPAPVSAQARPPAKDTEGPLPKPWLHTEIGDVGVAGKAGFAKGIFTLEGSGGGAYYVPDSLQFVYQAIQGDFTISAKVLSIENTHEHAKAGVMIRESLNADSAFADMIVAPAGMHFQYRASGENPDSKGTPESSLPRWLKITRAGDKLTGFFSEDGTNWTEWASATVAMADTVHVGLAQSSGIPDRSGTAIFSDVIIEKAKPAVSTGSIRPFMLVFK